MKKLLYLLSSVTLTLLLCTACNSELTYLYGPTYSILVSSMDSAVIYDIVHYDNKKNGKPRYTTYMAKDKCGMTETYLQCRNCHFTDTKRIVITRRDGNKSEPGGNGTMYIVFYEYKSRRPFVVFNGDTLMSPDLDKLFMNEVNGIPSDKPYSQYYDELNAICLDSTQAGVSIDIYTERWSPRITYSITYLYD